jgi:hypothetical protein
VTELAAGLAALLALAVVQMVWQSTIHQAELQHIKADRRRLLVAACNRAYTAEDMRKAFCMADPEAYLRHLLDDGHENLSRDDRAHDDEPTRP